MKRTVIVFILLGLLCGCACVASPSKEEIDKADCGEYPCLAPKLVRDYFSVYYLPDTTYKIIISKGYTRGGIDVPAQYCYYLDVWIVVKPRYGIDAGYPHHRLFCRDNVILGEATFISLEERYKPCPK